MLVLDAFAVAVPNPVMVLLLVEAGVELAKLNVELAAGCELCGGWAARPKLKPPPAVEVVEEAAGVARGLFPALEAAGVMPKPPMDDAGFA